MKIFNKESEFINLTKIFFKGQKWNTIWMFLLFIIKASPQWVFPIFIGKMIDIIYIAPEKRIFYIVVYGSIMILLFLQNIITHPLYIKYRSIISRGLSWKYRIKICRQLQQLSLIHYKRTKSGRVHSKFIRDIDLIENFPFIVVETIFAGIINILIAMVYILIKSPLCIFLFVLLVPVAILIRNKFHLKMKQGAELLRKNTEEMSAKVTEMINMIPITRAHGLEELEIEQVERNISNVYKSGLFFDVINHRFGAIAWASFMVCQALFLIILIVMAFKNFVTAGDIVIFNSFFTSIAGGVATLLNIMPIFTQIKESMKSVNELLNAPDIELNENKIKIQHFAGNFEFKNVSYVYPGAKNFAVRNLNFKIFPGESIAFIGPSGCGKTTILSLLLGFIRPNEGKILIDGQDINDIDMRSFRNLVGVVSQDSVLFSGTVKENIAYGETNINDGEIEKTLKLANLWDFVRSLPDGVYSKLGEGGVSLSGGQQQRVTIARALIREPKVLFLDEATSSLDVESESLVNKALEQIMFNQNTFIVSHRLSIMKNINRIYIMNNGEITGSGNHAELMQYENIYSSFYKQINNNLTFK